MKSDRFKQLMVVGAYERVKHFYNWFLQSVQDDILDNKLTLCTEETWFHLNWYISAQNNCCWSSINFRNYFEVQSED
jgi:hypothetical protein